MAKVIEGVGKDAPIHRHESGGLESKPAGEFVRSFPAKAILNLAKVIQHGIDRYAPNNWRLIPRAAHLNHALIHMFAYIAGDDQDDHLGHVLCRIAMAIELPDDRPYDTPEAGCAKCATDWTDAVHDGDCEEIEKVDLVTDWVQPARENGSYRDKDLPEGAVWIDSYRGIYMVPRKEV